MIAIGVDPGKSGAIAQIESDAMEIHIQPMPLIISKGSRPEFNIPEIRNILSLAIAEGEVFVTVEKLSPMPTGKMGGSIANYNRGCASCWSWILTAMVISHQLVTPRAWQKVMIGGTSGTDTKQRSLIAAQRLYPGVDLKRTPRCKKLSSGYSDALLLAGYGMRTYQGKV